MNRAQRRAEQRQARKGQRLPRQITVIPLGVAAGDQKLARIIADVESMRGDPKFADNVEEIDAELVRLRDLQVQMAVLDPRRPSTAGAHH